MLVVHVFLAQLRGRGENGKSNFFDAVLDVKVGIVGAVEAFAAGIPEMNGNVPTGRGTATSSLSSG